MDYTQVGALYLFKGPCLPLPVGPVNILESTSRVGHRFPTNSASARPVQLV